MMAKAGQMTSVRSGDNSAPLPPQQATLDLLVASGSDTDPGAPSDPPAATGAHLGGLGNRGDCGWSGRRGLGVGLTRGGRQTAREWVPPKLAERLKVRLTRVAFAWLPQSATPSPDRATQRTEPPSKELWER
jgi:hypothetical protein